MPHERRRPLWHFGIGSFVSGAAKSISSSSGSWSLSSNCARHFREHYRGSRPELVNEGWRIVVGEVILKKIGFVSIFVVKKCAFSRCLALLNIFKTVGLKSWVVFLQIHANLYKFMQVCRKSTPDRCTLVKFLICFVSCIEKTQFFMISKTHKQFFSQFNISFKPNSLKSNFETRQAI